MNYLNLFSLTYSSPSDSINAYHRFDMPTSAKWRAIHNAVQRKVAMFFRISADLVLILYLAFVVFALFGVLSVLKWPNLMRIHAPIALWTTMAMLTGYLFPLDLFEHALRLRAGLNVDKVGRVEQYLSPLFYPTPLTRHYQTVVGVGVLSLNIMIYSWLLWQGYKRRQR